MQYGWPALVGWRFLCVCAFDDFLLWFRIAYACPTTASLCNNIQGLAQNAELLFPAVQRWISLWFPIKMSGVSCRRRLFGALLVCSRSCVVGLRSWVGSPSWNVPIRVSCCCLCCYTCSPYCVSLYHTHVRYVFRSNAPSPAVCISPLTKHLRRPG